MLKMSVGLYLRDKRPVQLPVSYCYDSNLCSVEWENKRTIDSGWTSGAEVAARLSEVAKNIKKCACSL